MAISKECEDFAICLWLDIGGLFLLVGFFIIVGLMVAALANSFAVSLHFFKNLWVAEKIG